MVAGKRLNTKGWRLKQKFIKEKEDLIDDYLKLYPAMRGTAAGTQNRWIEKKVFVPVSNPACCTPRVEAIYPAGG